jgi:rfaE bifunctional protein nucleotidyltransferase chain/domain
VVCASGCFDLLHPGHIRLLEHAKSLGDILVVAIESDAAIRARSSSRNGSSGNSPARPITPATERAEILAALTAVDYVVEFEGATSRDFLESLRPDVIAMGGSGSSDPAARREAGELEALGCKIARIPLEPGFSTTRLIERILEPRA